MNVTITRVIIASVICVASVLAYAFWYSRVETKSAAVSSLQNQIQSITKNASRAESTRAALSEIKIGETAVHSYFIPETGVVSFIDDLQTRGHLQKADISVLSVSKDTSGSRPVLTFTISITGAFDAVMRTVGSIEYAPYDLTLSSLSLTKGVKSGWQADLKLTVGSVGANTINIQTP